LPGILTFVSKWHHLDALIFLCSLVFKSAPSSLCFTVFDIHFLYVIYVIFSGDFCIFQGWKLSEKIIIKTLKGTQSIKCVQINLF
jgi:hypothetical protein